jgi:hypothetical protein
MLPKFTHLMTLFVFDIKRALHTYSSWDAAYTHQPLPLLQWHSQYLSC